jgi:hypothetical protein
MKFIRLILLSVVAFFALACIVSFFIPSHIRVLRMVSIANSNDSVLNKVRDLAQWKSWYPGFENAALKDVQVQHGRVVKANIGDISLLVKESTDSAVVVSMQKGTRSLISGWQVNKDYRKDSLALQGYMDFTLKWYPWEKFSSLILNKSYGDILAQGLRNLKE